MPSALPGSWWGPRCGGCGPLSLPSLRADRPAPRCISHPPEYLSRGWSANVRFKEKSANVMYKHFMFSVFRARKMKALPSIRTMMISLMMVKVVHRTNMENRKVQMGSAILYSGYKRRKKWHRRLRLSTSKSLFSSEERGKLAVGPKQAVHFCCKSGHFNSPVCNIWTYFRHIDPK